MSRQSEHSVFTLRLPVSIFDQCFTQKKCYSNSNLSIYVSNAQLCWIKVAFNISHI